MRKSGTPYTGVTNAAFAIAKRPIEAAASKASVGENETNNNQ